MNIHQTTESDDAVERREVLAALMKYSAAVGAASTVALSASEVVAKSAASGRVKTKCNNGWGNGDDCVPGNSWPNQAENVGADPVTNPNPDNTADKPGN
ncbi:hypothetical protein [Ruegeria arenilitoris]|uniref:hypothetical protein n=1 Tax=Ruegeria arenilitoris TaxID=1173585 RepID=UPI00147E083F|nr:hypothetical protein [Ruegeria arenilitoris]